MNDNNRVIFKKDKIQTVLIVSLVYFIIYFNAGLFLGYQNSPYSHSLISIISNILNLVVLVIFREYIRMIFISYSNRKYYMYILITILFILSDIDFYNFSSHFISGEVIFKYAFSVILLKVASNILLTYLSIKGGCILGYVYLLPFNILKVFLPFFPNLDWYLSTLSSLIFIFFVFYILNYVVIKKETNISKRRFRKENPIKLIPFVFVMFLFLGFMTGLFKVSPVAIMSNSMYPLFERGDAVIVLKVDSKTIKQIKKYDIIEYKLGESVIVHRVIEIQKSSNGENVYITKGDNNKYKDSKKVKENQVLGIVQFSIPKIGYPSVMLNDFFENTKPNVETGE